MSATARRLPHSPARLGLVLVLLGLAACEPGPQFVVHQRHTEPVPGLDGKVTINVGDIERAKRADLRVLGPSEELLASASSLHVGDKLPFKFEGKTYTLKVTGYLDGTFTDMARLKILGLSEEQLARVEPPRWPFFDEPKPAPKPAPAPAPAPEPVAQSAPPSEPPPPHTSPEQGMAIAPAPLDASGEACGTRQATIQERIADCAKKQGSTVAGLGPGDAGPLPWQLVTRTASGRRVWLQVSTGKLWSDRLGRERFDFASWCRAKGEVGAAARVDCTPAPSPAAGAPSFAYAQLQPPESWCAEQAEFVTPTRFDESKGGMRLTATAHSPSVTWALPTEEEWNAAKADGAEAVLPDGRDPLFWPASLVKRGVMALVTKAIEARAGLTPEQAAQAGSMGTVLAVRCVGTPRP